MKNTVIMYAALAVVLSGCGDAKKDVEPPMSSSERADGYYSQLSADEYLYLFGDEGGNYRPEIGVVYFYRDNKALQVWQVLDGAVLARCRSRGGNPLMIATERGYVDNDWLTEGFYLCEGRYSYATVSGANVTTWKFREIDGEVGRLMRERFDKEEKASAVRAAEEREAAWKRHEKVLAELNAIVNRADCSEEEKMTAVEALWAKGGLDANEYEISMDKLKRSLVESICCNQDLTVGQKRQRLEFLKDSTGNKDRKLYFDALSRLERIEREEAQRIEDSKRATLEALKEKEMKDALAQVALICKNESLTIEAKKQRLGQLRNAGKIDITIYLNALDSVVRTGKTIEESDRAQKQSAVDGNEEQRRKAMKKACYAELQAVTEKLLREEIDPVAAGKLQDEIKRKYGVQ